MLGSWAEMKHDTVLYAKEAAARGMGTGAEGWSAGYVEPNPELFARLAALAEMTRSGLASRALLGDGDRAALERLQALTERLQAIAEKELAGQALSSDEQATILSYGYELYALAWAAAEGTPGGSPALSEYEAAIVADVATGGPSVLTVATGRVSRLYVVIPSGDKLVLAQGGVYAYYEFPWPASDRLTDHRWREMLKAGQVPPRPAWMQMFTVE